MGHGLAAGLLATVAVGAYRNARRRDLDLVGTVTATDTALAECFGGEQFAVLAVLAVLAELDLAAGRLSWHLAGHPPPLLLRGTRVVKTLQAEPSLPLGWGSAPPPAPSPAIGGETLEPGDPVLLFTDGASLRRAHMTASFSAPTGSPTSSPAKPRRASPRPRPCAG